MAISTNFALRINTMPRLVLLLVFAAMFIGFISVNSANAFSQTAVINIDKGRYDLGTYWISLYNLDTKKYLQEDYTDSTGSPQEVYTTWEIPASSGDQIRACLFVSDTNQSTCQDGYASRGYDLEFELDVGDAGLAG